MCACGGQVHTKTRFYRPKTLELARKPKYARKAVPAMPKMDKFRVRANAAQLVRPASSWLMCACGTACWLRARTCSPGRPCVLPCR